jgi:hypothetical protein
MGIHYLIVQHTLSYISKCPLVKQTVINEIMTKFNSQQMNKRDNWVEVVVIL